MSSSTAVMVFLLLVAVCISLTNAAVMPNKFDLTSKEKSEASVLKFVKESHLLHRAFTAPQHNHSFGQDSNDAQKGLLSRKNPMCACQGYRCGCCIKLDIKKIDFKDTACVNIVYLPTDLGIELTVKVGSIVLVNKTISVKNPPPVCAAIPGLKKLASVCIKFRDLEFKHHQLSACVDLEVVALDEVLEHLTLACFHVPAKASVARPLRPMSPLEMRLLVENQREFLAEELLHRVNWVQPAHDLTLRPNSICKCQGYDCGCCLHVDVQRIDLNTTGCVNISYLPAEFGFDFTISLNGIVLVEKKISVKNPPPVCAAIPHLKKLASVCIKFHDLDFKHHQLSGCAGLEIVALGEVLENFDLGCFHIPPKVTPAQHHLVIN